MYQCTYCGQETHNKRGFCTEWCQTAYEQEIKDTQKIRNKIKKDQN